MDEMVMKEISGVAEMLETWYLGYTPSPAILEDIVEQSINLQQELRDKSYTDTCVRETFLDCYTEAIGAKHWPPYGDATTDAELRLYINTLRVLDRAY